MNYYIIPGFKEFENINNNVLEGLQMRRILNSVCEHFNFSEDDLRGKCRRGNKPIARQIFFYLAHYYLKLGCSAISRFLGKDHTTAIHGYRRIKDLVSIKDRVIDDLEIIIAKINSESCEIYTYPFKKGPKNI